MNYYKEIKNRLVENENYERIKDYSKERYKVQTYYEVGKILSEAGKEYGENIIGQYAEKLQKEFGNKFCLMSYIKRRWVICSHLLVLFFSFLVFLDVFLFLIYIFPLYCFSSLVCCIFLLGLFLVKLFVIRI